MVYAMPWCCGGVAPVLQVLLRDSTGAHPIYLSYGASAWQLLLTQCGAMGNFSELMGSELYCVYLRAMGAKACRPAHCSSPGAAGGATCRQGPPDDVRPFPRHQRAASCPSTPSG